MIGEIFVCFLTLIALGVWVSVTFNIWTDRYLAMGSRIFISGFVTLIAAFMVVLIVGLIPTSTEKSTVPPDEYQFIKNDHQVVYLHKDDYKQTEDTYFHNNAGDTSKVEVEITKWINIGGGRVSTSMDLIKK